MKEPRIACPACHHVRKRVIDGDWVVICGIILRDTLRGIETYPNFEIVPSNCEDYTHCQVWRDEKEKGWAEKLGKRYSSLEQAERITL